MNDELKSAIQIIVMSVGNHVSTGSGEITSIRRKCNVKDVQANFRNHEPWGAKRR